MSAVDLPFVLSPSKDALRTPHLQHGLGFRSARTAKKSA